jgi:septum formation protein
VAEPSATPPLVLASASPRRAELLTMLGRSFEVRVVPVDESAAAGEDAAALVERLARRKAQAADTGPGEIVIAADTVVVLDGEIIGKPTDADDAAAILRRLSGRSHEVLTGVAVRTGDDVRSAVESTTVVMRSLGPDEIDDYVATGEPLDKAGAYGIQGLGGRFVERIDGSYHNVVGLPLTVVERLLSAASSPS